MAARGHPSRLRRPNGPEPPVESAQTLGVGDHLDLTDDPATSRMIPPRPSNASTTRGREEREDAIALHIDVRSVELVKESDSWSGKQDVTDGAVSLRGPGL